MFTFGSMRRWAGLAVGSAIALTSLPAVVFAQNASQASLREAAAFARARLSQEGYSITSLDGVPYYTGFLRHREVRNIRVNVPRRGNYVLLVSGDSDTVDLDIRMNQINASDVSFGRTAFLNFNVYRSGDMFYEIDMQRCDAPNCGVVAVLLRVGN